MKLAAAFCYFEAIWEPPYTLGVFVMFQHPSHDPVGPGDFMPGDAIRSALAKHPARATLARPRRWFVLAATHRTLQAPDFGESVRRSQVLARYTAKAGRPVWLVPPGFARCPNPAHGLAWAEPGSMPGQAWAAAGALGPGAWAGGLG
jgi:hypothetical protein